MAQEPLSDAVFRDMVEGAPDAIVVVDRAGTIVLVNAQAEVLFGYGRDDMLGAPVEMLVPERYRARHAGHRAGFVGDPRTRPMGADLLLFGLRKDGTEFPVEISLSPLRTGSDTLFSAAIRDVSERARAEEQFRVLLEAAPDAMVIVDGNGAIVLVNAQAERLFGYTRDEMLGAPVEMLVPERLRIDHADHRRSFIGDPRTRPMGAGIRLYCVRKDGIEVPVEISLSPLQTARTLLVSAAIRDVTERVREEEQAELLQGATRALGEGADQEDALRTMLRVVCERAGWEFGQAWLPGSSGGFELGPAWFEPDAALERFRAASEEMTDDVGAGAIGDVAATLEPAWFSVIDPQTFARAPQAREAGLVAAALIPVLAGQQVVAVIEFFARSQRARDERLLWVVTAIAGQLGALLERKRADDAVRASEERFRRISEQAEDIVYRYRITPDPALEYINPSIERILGYSPEEMYADPTLGIENEEDRKRAVHLDELGDQLPDEPFIATMRARDGRRVLLEHRTAIVRDADGVPVALEGIARDVTERERAAEAVRAALEREREAAERLRSLDQMKNTFLYAVSHELRSPLAVVVGFADTLAEHRSALDDAQVDRMIVGIANNASRLNKLLTDLLDLDRLSRGVFEPNRVECDLREILTRVVDEIDAGERTVSIEGTETDAFVDPSKVERILENLVVNAARYSPDGSRIDIHIGRIDGTMLVEVADRGPGVPDAYKERIFNAFDRGEAPASIPGTGIGLSLVARFAELHGGRAWVEDREGGGAVFKVLLPDAQPGEQATDEAPGA